MAHSGVAVFPEKTTACIPQLLGYYFLKFRQVRLYVAPNLAPVINGHRLYSAGGEKIPSEYFQPSSIKLPLGMLSVNSIIFGSLAKIAVIFSHAGPTPGVSIDATSPSQMIKNFRSTVFLAFVCWRQ